MDYFKFDREINCCNSVTEIINVVLRYVSSKVDCDACAVILHDEASGNLVLKEEYTSGFDFVPKEVHYAIGQGITGKAVERNEPKIINKIPQEINKDPKAYFLHSSLKVKSSMAVPISKGDRVYGAITADSNKINHFQKTDIDKLLQIAPKVGQRLYRVKTDELDAQKHNEEERTLSARKMIEILIDDFAALGDEEKLIENVLDLIHRMTPYDACAIFARGKERGDITLVKSRNLNESIPKGVLYNLQRSPVNDILEDGRSILEVDAASPIKEPEFRYLLHLIDFRSCIATTYEAGEEERHAVFFFHRERNQYTVSDLIILLTISVLFSTLQQKKKLNNAVQRFNQQINISDIVPGMVHEIRNAQMTVVGLSGELKHVFSNSNQHFPDDLSLAMEMLENILKTSHQVNNWLNEFLASSQIQDRKMEKIDINQLTKTVISLLNYQANLKNIRIEFHPEQNEIFSITDSIGLRQVFINLLLNPIQILGRGKKIEIRTKLDSTEELPIIVTVYDNGKGIHKKNLDKIFRPYYSTRGGTGLGLFISKKIVEELGGTIDVDSVLYYGTTFTVKLPKDSRVMTVSSLGRSGHEHEEQ